MDFKQTDNEQRESLLADDYTLLDDLPWLHREYCEVKVCLGVGELLDFREFCYQVCFKIVT